jgi:glycosyltransferase involved in cell wall biosynthesis
MTMNTDKQMNLAFLSTFPPRECGLATFTQDLVLQLVRIPATARTRVIAVSNAKLPQDHRVMMELDQNDRKSYSSIAQKINHSDIDLLVIEHEYGIFGGDSGEYILDLIRLLTVPFVTTLHTVLGSPLKKQRQILREIAEKSEKIITMAQNTVAILVSEYGIDPLKIEVIHHGVPQMPMKTRETLKMESGFTGRPVISTFGLLGPGKGLEYGIEAIAQIAKKHPNVIYLILGQTHPAIIKESGEAYRLELESMVRDLGLEDNVRFVNKYLTKEEIVKNLTLSDIYMTPYLGKDQAVSGTLAYAAGYGRVIISTPYMYAKEMLSGGRGLLADFRDADSLAKQIDFVLCHPDEKARMEDKTLAIGRTMMWHVVADKYVKLFSDILMLQDRDQVTA